MRVASACLFLLTISPSLAFIPSKGLHHGVVNTHMRDLCKCETSVKKLRMMANAQISDSSAESQITLGRRELFHAFFLTAAVSSLGAGPKYSAAEADEDLLSGIGSSRRPIVVIGAGGKTGKECVRALLRKGGYSVRAAARGELRREDLGTESISADDVDLLTGVDVTKPETLAQALAGAGACIFASSASGRGGNALQVDCLGAENVARACLKAGVPRLVLISSLAVTRPDSLGYKFTNILGNIMDYKEQGEERVRAAYAGQTRLSYTILRPGGLKNGKPVGLAGLQVSQGDTISGEVDRADVAEAAVGAVFAPSTAFTTFELMSREGAGPLQNEFKADPYFVSGLHTTARAYPMDAVLTGPSESSASARAAFAELYGGLKRDSDYDPANAYVPRKPAPPAAPQ